jgi:hypothetical protein
MKKAGNDIGIGAKDQSGNTEQNIVFSLDIIEKELVAATKNSESPLEVFLAYY